MSLTQNQAIRLWPLIVATLIIPLNYVVLMSVHNNVPLYLALFGMLAVLQLVLAIAGIVRVLRGHDLYGGLLTGAISVYGGLLALVALGSGALGALIVVGGAAWGRPLRVRGRQIHVRLASGEGWAAGQQPQISDLDPASARALEALWLHDAQKEHASVPAFARLTWLLIAAGAPGDLVAWSQRACSEEIDHARRCFALASGYGGTTHTVMPMPELIGSAMDGVLSAPLTLAVESVKDGCLLEDYNADIASACAKVCEEPATKAVLEQIAREERSHAAFSWAVLRWCLCEHKLEVLAAVREAQGDMSRIARPTAVTDAIAPLVVAGDPVALRRHGRLPDSQWAEIWERRRILTQERLEGLLVNNVALAG